MARSGVTVVLGGQWGDEGKGKLVDILAQNADVVARCQVSCQLGGCVGVIREETLETFDRVVTMLATL